MIPQIVWKELIAKNMQLVARKEMLLLIPKKIVRTIIVRVKLMSLNVASNTINNNLSNCQL